MLTWRGLESVKDVVPGEGIGRIPIVVIAGATLSMATAALMHHLHHRVSRWPSASARENASLYYTVLHCMNFPDLLYKIVWLL